MCWRQIDLINALTPLVYPCDWLVWERPHDVKSVIKELLLFDEIGIDIGIVYFILVKYYLEIYMGRIQEYCYGNLQINLGSNAIYVIWWIVPLYNSVTLLLILFYSWLNIYLFYTELFRAQMRRLKIYAQFTVHVD